MSIVGADGEEKRYDFSSENDDKANALKVKTVLTWYLHLAIYSLPWVITSYFLHVNFRQGVGYSIKPVLKGTNARRGCIFSGDVEAVEVFEVTCVLIHGEGNTHKMFNHEDHVFIKIVAVSVTVNLLHPFWNHWWSALSSVIYSRTTLNICFKTSKSNLF